MGEKKASKVQFNLKNVHYAPLELNGDVPSWGTPVPVPGAVNLNLEPQGEVTPFYADGIVYYQSVGNNGYNGDLEIARFPDQMLIDIWGYKKVEGDNVLIENSNVEAKPFALLYQIDGDATESLFCMYNCTGTRPGISSTTNTDVKEPQTQTSTISAVSLPSGDIFARTTHETPDQIVKNWYQKVYEKGQYTLLTVVSVSGTAQVGETLTATVAPSGATVDYRWLVSDSEDGEYTAIPGKTESTLVLEEAQNGKYIKAEAMGKEDYVGTVLSAATEAVAAMKSLKRLKNG